ncbi:MAG: carboxypeptidase-like regulatory domain-containing protein, partial [Salinimicrobium sediminis]|nr:carboxypeptidase-like regulatory domain-containing protein [Salinimicrobium sediminis]
MKIITLLLMLIICNFVFAQDSSQKINLTLQGATIKEGLLELESQSGHKFFFADDWVNQGSLFLELKNATLEDALQKILSKTPLNYYQLAHGPIVITRNNIIYDQLPEGFFPKKDSIVEKAETAVVDNYNPIFYGPTKRSQTNIETVYIGKQDQTSGRRIYTLSGTVKSLETGEPIANLAVLVQGTEIGTVTNQAGFYSLRIPAGTHILETRSFGNEEVQKRLLLYNDGSLDLNLREDYELLGEIMLESNPDKNVN